MAMYIVKFCTTFINGFLWYSWAWLHYFSHHMLFGKWWMSISLTLCFKTSLVSISMVSSMYNMYNIRWRTTITNLDSAFDEWAKKVSRAILRNRRRNSLKIQRFLACESLNLMALLLSVLLFNKITQNDFISLGPQVYNAVSMNDYFFPAWSSSMANTDVLEWNRSFVYFVPNRCFLWLPRLWVKRWPSIFAGALCPPNQRHQFEDYLIPMVLVFLSWNCGLSTTDLQDWNHYDSPS